MRTAAPVPATADLMDTESTAVSVHAPLRHYGGRTFLHGAVRTVLCHEDNALVRSLAAEPGHGRVLVVDGGGSPRAALVGGEVARNAAANGWSGIVVNGAVRDVAELRLVDLCVLALTTSPRRAERAGRGEVDVPVAFGGAVIVPGTEIVGDEDGLVLRPGGGDR